MKQIFLALTIFLLLTLTNHAEDYIGWGSTGCTGFTTGTTYNGTSYNCYQSFAYSVSHEVYRVNKESGAVTILKSWDVGGSGIHNSIPDTPNTPSFGNKTFYDTASGYLYADQGDGSYWIYDLNNEVSLVGTQVSPVTPSYVAGNQNFSMSGSNVLGMSQIVDAEGKIIIKKESDGSVHIGENSLVTDEVNGVQQLYATDANGDQIDINIKSGTNLLIDGTNITLLSGSGSSGSGSAVSTNTSNIAANTAAINNLAVDLSGSVALSSALSALPNSSPDAFYTCGLGTGIHDSSSALSAGCASDFSNYAFADSLPKIFQTASFNIGSSFLMNGEPDISEARDMSIKAGITFKFGSIKPTRVSDKQNHMLDNKIDAVMAENDLLKAQIAEINTQLKALNMLAMN